MLIDSCNKVPVPASDFKRNIYYLTTPLTGQGDVVSAWAHAWSLRQHGGKQEMQGDPLHPLVVWTGEKRKRPERTVSHGTGGESP